VSKIFFASASFPIGELCRVAEIQGTNPHGGVDTEFVKLVRTALASDVFRKARRRPPPVGALAHLASGSRRRAAVFGAL